MDRFTDGTGWGCPGILPDGSACGYELRTPAAEVEELRTELVIANRRWDRVAKDCRALTAEVVAGLSTPEHTMVAVAGLPECRCGLPLGGGDASGSFITHALAVLADGSPCDYELRTFPVSGPRDRDEIRRAAVRAVLEAATDYGHDGLVVGEAEKFADAVLAVCMASQTA